MTETRQQHKGIDAFEEIRQANASIVTTDIKGKDYAQVNERVKAFRMVHPLGTIETEIINIEDGVVTMQAKVYAEGNFLLATGFAQEKESSSFINKTSFIENCETSAVGRALGMCGFGIDTSICSAEELKNALANQGDAKPAHESNEDKAKAMKYFIEKRAEAAKYGLDIHSDNEVTKWLKAKAKVQSLDPAALSNEQLKVVGGLLDTLAKKKAESYIKPEELEKPRLNQPLDALE